VEQTKKSAETDRRRKKEPQWGCRVENTDYFYYTVSFKMIKYIYSLLT